MNIFSTNLKSLFGIKEKEILKTPPKPSKTLDDRYNSARLLFGRDKLKQIEYNGCTFNINA